MQGWLTPRPRPRRCAAAWLALLTVCGVWLSACGVPAADPAPAATQAQPPASAITAPPAATGSGAVTPAATPRATGSPEASAAPQATPAPATDAPAPAALRLTTVLRGLEQPLFLTHAGDGSGDLYVVEKGGKIRLASNGAVREPPFLDISARVRSSGSEQGLLGLAFHPDFKANGHLFVNYTDQNGDTVIARFTAPGDRRAADPASAKTILAIDQPYANHNGGMLAFGPDGMLWIGMGDGGSGGDPRGNGQDLGQLLGKLLRIDVNHGDPYAVPPDNPFAGQAGARGEIWALGLRNPWRFSFDRGAGDLYLGDVGQNSWEEVNVAPAGSKGGLNFGWNRMEGSHCYPSGSRCDPAGLAPPILDYPTGREGCSVVGGYVYRGRAIPAAQGVYYFTDYCSGALWAASRDAAGLWRRTVSVAPTSVGAAGHSSMGEDQAGELYVTDLDGGVVYQLTEGGP